MNKKIRLSDIKIKSSFEATTPKKEKMEECRNNWNTYHKQDRYIVVNKDKELIDGYIQYLVLKENGMEEADVKISNRRKKCWYRKNVKEWATPHYKNNMTTYIYGMHFNKKLGVYSKEYVWRVPDSWIGWENDLLPGDEIMVCTKYGLAPIVITKIKITDQCPVDMPVRKVYRKLVNKK